LTLLPCQSIQNLDQNAPNIAIYHSLVKSFNGYRAISPSVDQPMMNRQLITELKERSNTMTTLVHITSSITGDNSHSTRLSNEFVAKWQKLNPSGKVIQRNLAADAIPHLDGTRLQALFTPTEQRTDAQQAIVDYSDALIAELRNADAVVLGVPLYNFGLPSTLKAYFDHIARVGVTFRYTANGPEGLLPNIPVYVFATRGGHYAGGPADWQLNTFLNFVGFKDIETVYAEGLALGEESTSKSVHAAQEKIAQLLAA
jgi:FMN-dependent NADH-azoreductase